MIPEGHAFGTTMDVTVERFGQFGCDLASREVVERYVLDPIAEGDDWSRRPKWS
jgi:hypothetical protein